MDKNFNDFVKDTLGEKIPEIEFSKLGKYKLIQLLRYNYGPNFKDIPAAIKILKDFDREMSKES